MDSIIGLILIAVGIYIVLSIIGAFVRAAQEIDGDEKSALKTKLAELTHVIRSEEHAGRSYWFDAEDDKFLAWGDTQAEVINNLKVRWPNHIFYLNSTQEIVCATTDWTPKPFPVNK